MLRSCLPPPRATLTSVRNENLMIGAQLSNYNYYASPNAAAEPYLDEALKQPPAQPTEEEMKRLRFTPSLEGEQLRLVLEPQLSTRLQGDQKEHPLRVEGCVDVTAFACRCHPVEHPEGGVIEIPLSCHHPDRKSERTVPAT